MMNKKIVKAILTVATVVMLAGCAQDKTDESASSETKKEVQSQEQSQEQGKQEESQAQEQDVQEQSQAQEQDAQDDEKELTATITVRCAYENGAPDIVEVMNVSDVTDRPEEDGSVICGYDAEGKLVYRREASSFTDENGIVNVTITYVFHTLEHDFDFQIDPLEPENGGNIQTLNGTIVVNTKSGESSKDFTFETVGLRGQTGIWYAGICSCRDGVLGDFMAQ